MLAGYLPFHGGIDLPFPEYFPPRVKNLVAGMLVKQSTKRAELFEVAHHDWLSGYLDMIKRFTVIESYIWAMLHHDLY